MALLEKEDGKSSSFWDWFVGIGLFVLIGGFTFYYQAQKRVSHDGFRRADSLFAAGNYPEAVRAYEELKTAAYLTTAHDSLIYARLDSAQILKTLESEFVAHLRAQLAAGNVAGVRAALDTTRFHGLLPASEQAWVDSARAALRRP